MIISACRSTSTAQPARLLPHTCGVRQQVFALAAGLCLTNALAATPPGTPISNTASAAYSVGADNLSASSTVVVNTAGCVDVSLKIELLQYLSPARAALAPAGGVTVIVQPTAYAPSGALAGPFVPLTYPTLLGNPSPTALPVSLLLSPMSDAAGNPLASYARNEPIFMRVVSFDSNIDPAVADKVEITITTSSGDSEVLQLSETGPSTGVFSGAAPSVFAAPGTTPTPNDGKISIATRNETLTEVYNHRNCSSGANITRSSGALIDPHGIVFDSASGAPVNGVAVSLIDALTNLPATVYCSDAVTVMPQPAISGAPTICDATMAPGGFNFPYVAAGSYRATVIPTPGYRFPSVIAAAGLPATVGTPPMAPAILGSPSPTPGGSYGGAFVLAGAALRIDLPLDTGSTSLTIQKSAGKAVVGTGEFAPYTLSITNNNATTAATGAQIADHLPAGFRYQKGSARLDGAPAADPLITPDARTLTFTLNLAAVSTVTLRYVLEVTPGAHPGTAENTAAATGAYTSNTARARVLVREDMFRNKAMLIGRVIDGACDDRNAPGLASARVMLQDGRHVLTDKEGRWHMDDLRPGTHVVQLDMDSLPKDREVFECEQNTRLAGRLYSQFVNLRGGTLWRADFHVRMKTGISGLLPDLKQEEPSKSIPAADDPAHLLEVLPYDAAWLASAQPGDEWLHPQESFHPNLPVMKLAVKHAPSHRLSLKVNGATVDPLTFDGTQFNAAHDVALSTWNGVPLKEGDNHVELVIADAQGVEILRTLRNIHYAATADHVEFVPQQSRLIADGKTRPIIAVRFFDRSGVPVRRGVRGEFQLNEPYRAYDRRAEIERDPLTGALDGKPRFEINRDGLALIELEPTTQSGEAILNFQFNDQRTQELRTWLQAGKRDWILVGFGEGTLGHKTLSGNMQAAREAEADQQLFDGDKLAFYAKGSIRGDYLLTMAYDTAKQLDNKQLKQAINPSQYYTLYGDATQTGFDAASASRLYLKLERDQFYAMFGDYDTGLTVTELSRYSRSLNGVKSEYKGESASYNVFATVTAQAYLKDEIAGNGTSGLYKLSRGDVVLNSDKIRIETRDRFQSQIIVSTRFLTRYLDYDIDYMLGTLSFREPIATRDGSFNPTYIVAEYESADPADKSASFGGRASYKPGKDVEIGTTLISDGTVGATGDLEGLDVSYQLDEHTRLRAEAASTQRMRTGISSRGGAWLGEVQHHDEKWDARLYAREQAAAFGMGQQANSEMAMRKTGADVRVKLSDDLSLQGQAYRQENLTSNANNNVLEGRLNQKLNDDLNIFYGARTAQDHSNLGNAHSNQIIAGAAYTMPDKKLALHTAAEIGSGTAGSATMPDRLTLGADYKLTERSRLFAEQEFARGEQISANTTRAGLRSQAWTGGEISASVGNNSYNDAERMYGNLGLVQRWQINPQWQTDFGLERSQTLRNTAVALNPDTPLPSGTITEDYTSGSLGAAYHESMWSGNGRIEIRNAVSAQQNNVLFGMQRKLDAGRSMAAGYTLRNTHDVTGGTRDSDLRLSYAHRPNDSDWVWFERVDYITRSSQLAASTLDGAKLVSNLNANTMLDRRTQLAFQYGFKFVRDNIDAAEYRGFTDLIGAEIRHDIDRDWDIGAHASLMRSVNSGVRDYGMGVSLGYKVMENTWVALGYNLRGLSDRDFTAGAYRARGLYLTLRIKIDQDTFGLNEDSATPKPMTAE